MQPDLHHGLLALRVVMDNPADIEYKSAPCAAKGA